MLSWVAQDSSTNHPTQHVVGLQQFYQAKCYSPMCLKKGTPNLGIPATTTLYSADFECARISSRRSYCEASRVRTEMRGDGLLHITQEKMDYWPVTYSNEKQCNAAEAKFLANLGLMPSNMLSRVSGRMCVAACGDCYPSYHLTDIDNLPRPKSLR